MKPNFLLLGAIALATGAMLAGCTTTAGTAASEGLGARPDGGGGAPARTDAARQTAGAPSSTERAMLILAEEELTSRCMRAKGLVYHAIAPSGAELDAAERAGGARLERVFGSDDVERARRQGYGLADQPDPAQRRAEDPVANHPNTKLVKSLTPVEQRRYTEALFGKPDETATLSLPGGGQLSVSVAGCVAEARVALYGDVKEYMRLDHVVNNLESEVVRRVLRDERYARVLDAWRACMARQGYRYRDAAGAYADMAERYDQASVGRSELRGQELRLALADARCNRDARLAATARRLHKEAEAHLATEREGEVLAYRELQAAALGKARALVAAG